MRVAIALIGSRGDIQPALALGVELQSRGHDVVVGVPRHLERLATGCNLAAVPFDYDPAAFVEESPVLKKALMQGINIGTIRSVPALWREISRFRELVSAGVRTLVEMCKGADLIIANQTTQFLCSAVSKEWGIPLAALHLHPCVPNSFFRAPSAASDTVLSKRATRNTWKWHEFYLRFILYPFLMGDGIRTSLGVRKIRVAPGQGQEVLEIQAYSGDLIPGIEEELGAHRPFVGPLRLPSDTRTKAGESADSHDGLVEWIESGDAPVFLGFGSYSKSKPQAEFVALAEEIAEHLGERVLVNMESPGISETSERVRVVGPVAHDFIFPRCRAAVVHGGAGTLHEVLHAGIPVLVGWINIDQPVWGSMVDQAGLGASARLASLSEASVLKDKITSILAPRVVETAQRFGQKMREREPGAKLAADAVESRFFTPPTAPPQKLQST
ncbi:MAG: glycosyltransferase [Segniliparus sp.]|uniref:glycosyltransferase n=1 Tax=Segniliparus sp. TaxID=2804064 RepID=UPI003F336457